MAESNVNFLGHPRKGMHSVECQCGHSRCRYLEEHKWCCHWFFLYWVPARQMLPTEVVRVLRDRLGTTEFDYFVKPSSTGALRMLVYVEDYSVLANEHLDSIPERLGGILVRQECQFWRLTCCEEVLETDWEHWRSFLKDSSGPPAFSGPRVGGLGLLRDLEDIISKRMGLE